MKTRIIGAVLGFLVALGLGVAIPNGAQAAPARTVAGGEVYGWSWNHQVKVYDGTGDPAFDVVGAVTGWDRASGLETVMVSDPSIADVAYFTQDGPVCAADGAACSVGWAYTETMSFVDNHPVSQCKIGLSNNLRGKVYQQWAAAHEFGHCIGMAHVYANVNSLMLAVTDGNLKRYIDTPTNYDKANAQLLYGR